MAAPSHSPALIPTAPVCSDQPDSEQWRVPKTIENDI